MEILTKIDSSVCLDRIDAGYFLKSEEPPTNSKSLKEMAYVFGGKRLAKGDYFTEEDTRYKYLRVTDIKDLTVDVSNLFSIQKYVHEKIKQYVTREGDIVISIAGTIGEVAMIPRLDNIILNLTENAAKILTIKGAIDPEYLLLAMNTDYVKRQETLETIQTGVPKLALERINELKIPIADNQEQIVAFRKKVESVVNELKKEGETLKREIEGYLAVKLNLRLVSNPHPAFSSDHLRERFDFLNVNARVSSRMVLTGKTIRLGSVTYSYNKGNSPKPDEIAEDVEDFGDYYPLLRIQDISRDNHLQLPVAVWVRKYINDFSYTFLEKEDLIFVITGATIGKVAIVDKLEQRTMLGGDDLSPVPRTVG